MKRDLTLRFIPHLSKNGVWKSIKIFGTRAGKRIRPTYLMANDQLDIETLEFRFKIVGSQIKTSLEGNNG